MLGSNGDLADPQRQMCDNHKEKREMLSRDQEWHLQMPWSLREFNLLEKRK